MGDHMLEELIPDEDGDGLFVVWVCECGRRGRAATQQTAHSAWRKHAERGENVWCGGVR